ncbi:M23 family metallopeptidase [Paenibacillus sp. FSL K6-1230]|uniref:M23 family metallopeptidase n=1 Tax=Paenibacillus sp. FSL K6-1230 TaxID=2921603 RepID=UPI0030FBABBE
MTNPFDGYRLTSPFGYRTHPVDQVRRFHRGVDLVITPPDGEIKAFTSGLVLHAKLGVTGSGFGNMGIIVAIRDVHGYLHVYAHLSSAGVKEGQQVQRGQVIGRQGSTGSSTGPHLHYEIRRASSPSYGYTPTEAGVVEPTQYLINYYRATEPGKENPVAQERDVHGVSPWAEKDWKEAEANGYFDGSRPGAPMTREEAAIVINRLRRNFLTLIGEVGGNVKELDERLKRIERATNQTPNNS